MRWSKETVDRIRSLEIVHVLEASWVLRKGESEVVDLLVSEFMDQFEGCDEVLNRDHVQVASQALPGSETSIRVKVWWDPRGVPCEVLGGPQDGSVWAMPDPWSGLRCDVLLPVADDANPEDPVPVAAYQLPVSGWDDQTSTILVSWYERKLVS